MTFLLTPYVVRSTNKVLKAKHHQKSETKVPVVQRKVAMSSKKEQDKKKIRKPQLNNKNLHMKSTVTWLLLSSLMLEQRRSHLSWLATPTSGLIVQFRSQLGTSFTCWDPRPVHVLTVHTLYWQERSKYNFFSNLSANLNLAIDSKMEIWIWPAFPCIPCRYRLCWCCWLWRTDGDVGFPHTGPSGHPVHPDWWRWLVMSHLKDRKHIVTKFQLSFVRKI